MSIVFGICEFFKYLYNSSKSFPHADLALGIRVLEEPTLQTLKFWKA